MNKTGIAVILIIIGVLAYIKINEPKIQEAGKNASSGTTIDVDQQALPDSAKGLVDEIKNEHKDDNYQGYITEEEKEHQRQIEEQIRKEERRHQEEMRLMEMDNIKPVEEIPFVAGTTGSRLNWPCKTATFAEIIDSYGSVWGRMSVAPHDEKWYKAVANGLTDYAACRAVTSNDPNVCDRLSVIDLSNSEFENISAHEFRGITDKCKEKLASFYLTLYSVGKATSRLCSLFRAPGVDGDICMLSQQKRGESLCSSLGLNEEEKQKCLSYLPEQESDCSRLTGAVAEDCRENIKIYQAVKYDNVKLCPPGRAGVICMAYFAKESPDACRSHMDRLSKNYCSGGKYSESRTPRRKNLIFNNGKGK
jgi:hypothetical protein